MHGCRDPIKFVKICPKTFLMCKTLNWLGYATIAEIRRKNVSIFYTINLTKWFLRGIVIRGSSFALFHFLLILEKI